jgi:DNA-binding response OmpR family regulator
MEVAPRKSGTRIAAISWCASPARSIQSRRPDARHFGPLITISRSASRTGGLTLRAVRILIVDDHEEIHELLTSALGRDGHHTVSAGSVAEALAALADQAPDVIVLDLALPDGSGVALCRALRRRGERAPILLLTAHGDVTRRIEGLDAGADDFLAKPFAVGELRARVRALARRGPMPATLEHRVGDVALAISERRARKSERDVPLTTREWAVLELLASRRGRVVGREEILDAIWGSVDEAANASLAVIIARIRRKLGPAVLRTQRGEGYGLATEG